MDVQRARASLRAAQPHGLQHDRRRPARRALCGRSVRVLRDGQRRQPATPARRRATRAPLRPAMRAPRRRSHRASTPRLTARARPSVRRAPRPLVRRCYVRALRATQARPRGTAARWAKSSRGRSLPQTCPPEPTFRLHDRALALRTLTWHSYAPRLNEIHRSVTAINLRLPSLRRPASAAGPPRARPARPPCVQARPTRAFATG